jgi:hypothetical protein
VEFKIQYVDVSDRQRIIKENSDKLLVEEQNIIDGNFLIFSDDLNANKNKAATEIGSGLIISIEKG